MSLRVLPVIEVVLIAIIALVILALLVFAWCWHRHVVAIDSLAAAQVPRAGVTLPTPMDPELYQAVHAWSDPFITRAFAGGYDRSYVSACMEPEVAAWFVHPGATRPAQVAFLLDRVDVSFDAAPGLLARGMRGATTALHEAACRDDLRAADATTAAGAAVALDELDAYATACATPASVGDLENADGILDHRDQAYLATALRGTLPEAERLRWQRETAGQERRRMLVAMEGERLVHARVEMRPRVMESPLVSWRQDIYPPPSLATFPSAFAAWWDLPQNFAFNLAILAKNEEVVAGTAWDDHSEGRIWLNRITSRTTRHRLTVLTVALVAMHRATGAFPADTAPLGTDPACDLGPGPERASLIYTRSDGDHCAIHLDPAATDGFTRSMFAGDKRYPHEPPGSGTRIDDQAVVLDLAPGQADDGADLPAR